ncbi:DsbA family protein [Streptacidiphilus monticola]|uniref:DsbA family protein n=1 Tax=Streptacidiphilus monticola TaxID=2161674 RepID=A0ABW1FT23_9ACTN
MSQQQFTPPSPRDRVAAARAAEQRSRLVRNGVIAAVVTVVIGLVAAIGIAVLVTDHNKPKHNSATAAAVPAHADGTVIVYGNPKATATLDVYEDFRCPVCGALERTDGKKIQELADNGTYKIRYHMGTFLDGNLGGSGSADALAAAGAVLNQGTAQFKAFHDLLYANQPAEETTDAFADANTLAALAAKVPGLNQQAYAAAVKAGTYKNWAADVSAAFDSSGVTGTPTLALNGKQLNVFSNQGPISPTAFEQLVKQTIG